MDINSENWTIDIDQVKKNITKKTKAIMAVHLYGHSADMDELKRFVIEIKFSNC